MIVTCPNCETRYNLPEDKLPAGGAMVKCSKCSHVFKAAPPALPEDEVENLLEDESPAAGADTSASDDFDDAFNEVAGGAAEETTDSEPDEEPAEEDSSAPAEEDVVEEEPAQEEPAEDPVAEEPVTEEPEAAPDETDEAVDDFPDIPEEDDLPDDLFGDDEKEDTDDLFDQIAAEAAAQDEANEEDLPDEVAAEGRDMPDESDVDSLFTDDTDDLDALFDEGDAGTAEDEPDDELAEDEGTDDLPTTDEHIKSLFDDDDEDEEDEISEPAPAAAEPTPDVDALFGGDDDEEEDESPSVDDLFGDDEEESDDAGGDDDIFADDDEEDEALFAAEGEPSDIFGSDEDEDEEPPSAESLNIDEPVKKGKKSLGCLIIILVAALLLGGGIFLKAWTWFGVDLDAYIKDIPVIGAMLVSEETATEDAAPGESPEDKVRKIELKNVKQYYVANEKTGNLFVVEGKAVNMFNEPKERIKVEVVLYDGSEQVLTSKSFLCGNVLSQFQLQVQTQKEIEDGLASEVGILSNNTFLRPGASSPFMAVFFQPPPEVRTFLVKVVDVGDPQ